MLAMMAQLRIQVGLRGQVHEHVQRRGCMAMLAHTRWEQVTVGFLQGGEGGLMSPSPLFCVSGDMETRSETAGWPPEWEN